MSLKERLMEDMKQAMKDKEAGKFRLSVIRMARSAIQKAEIDKRRDLTDEELLEVLAREVKQRRDSMVEYEKAGRTDAIDALKQEIDILTAYLPQQLSEEEVRALVREAMAVTGAQGPRDIGKVMGVLMPKVKGRADGKLVNQIVKESLG
ncbi:GatB/YqeY domain-containing protein [Heliobacillus mobilis]|uniref:GatB/YqeY domain-containing protein n=2 Tax=Heliobacterium TaxID=2697 RepID=A0A6I3SMF1_HELMO|nr:MULTISPECIES: GatB/YqeY domain-containing protein [Heliobacterium]MBC9785042.1 GatB/YqeY domain-containing protein [Heliobacterium chlorum]MTV50144.1 GatB/YqeY domain-containing protein [Heliobacterium mobile]